MKEFRLLDTGHISAAENMALDAIILDEVAEGRSPATLRYLQFRPAAALVGYHQDAELEIRTQYCREHGIDVNRRLTGGGGIFFQESALGWELFGRIGEEPFFGSYEKLLTRICSVAATGLSRLGIDAQFRPRNDIEVDGRKISGTGGVTASAGFMFQGTVLMHNDVESFLKALRVPVEKLKKREIESLLERICFLSDLLDPCPPVAEVKHALAEEFGEALGIRLIPAGLTDREQSRLTDELTYYQSDSWVFSRSRPTGEAEPTRSIMQTRAGTMRVHLFKAPGGRRIRQALIVGDFFAVPGRLVHDLEAALVGERLEPAGLYDRVRQFFRDYPGHVLGISADEIAGAVAQAAERMTLVNGTFDQKEANELFLVNIRPDELPDARPAWLLLPYCSKDLACGFRLVSGCERCGMCDIGQCCDIGDNLGIKPITIQSFEHLMEVLSTECRGREEIYVGSCCEAFYAKHQQEMEAIDARGVLVNLDSTTCYDLGKGTFAYAGKFDNQTHMNLPLLTKTLRHLHGQSD